MTSAKLGALVMACLVVIYLVLLGQQGYLFLIQDEIVPKIMGVAILILPLFGAWGIYRELRFGLAIERLAKTLEHEGLWPKFEFSQLPSGRANKAEAKLEFDRYKSEAEAEPSNWRCWFALGLIYDACGDRKRARSAMRRAISTSRG